MTAAEVAELLERSDERDAWLRRVLDAERRGFALGVVSQAGEYVRGFADGCLALKAAQHDAHRLAELDARRWSLHGEPRTREAFGLPHADDFRAAAPREAWSWLAGPSVHRHAGPSVHRPAGPNVHRHACTATCWEIRPGFYSPTAAADILEQLPGDYADEIARLGGAR